MPAVIKRIAPYKDDAMNLPVHDVAAAVPFYESVLGFGVVSREDTPRRKAVLGRDGVKMAVVENGGDPTQEGCFFEVDNVEQAWADFKANGLKQDQPKYRVDKQGDESFKVFFVIAPDGLCYCIGQRVG